MPDIRKHYYAKVLLFGEYTVIDGSAALAIPFKKYGGTWAINNDIKSDKSGLEKLKSYIATEYYKGNIKGIDYNSFERDLTRGLVFDSTIPTGYGLGSSGSLVAAFFDKYFEKEMQYDLPELKSILGLIESCFHGNSSGLDPLVSLLNMPILVHPDESIEILDNNKNNFLQNIRLLDTGIPRATEPLVKAYKYTREKSPEFQKDTLCLAELTDQVITAYVLDNEDNYISYFKKLSAAQLSMLPMLIPEKYRQLWKKGLDLNAFYMKLCGAGGGGFILMHINNESLSQKILYNQKTLSII